MFNKILKFFNKAKEEEVEVNNFVMPTKDITIKPIIEELELFLMQDLSAEILDEILQEYDAKEFGYSVRFQKAVNSIMRNDPTVKGDFRTRVSRVLGLEYDFKNLNKNNNMLDFITQELMEHINIYSLIKFIASSIIRGYSVTGYNDYIENNNLTPINLHKFGTKYFEKNFANSEFYKIDGEIDKYDESNNLKKYKCFVCEYAENDDDEEQIALSILKLVSAKYKVFVMWLKKLSLFGVPPLIGKLQNNDEYEKSLLRNALSSISNNNWGMMLDVSSIEVLDAKFGGANDFLSCINYINAEISKIILGNPDLTEKTTHGTYGQSAIKSEKTTDEILKDDARFVENNINRFFEYFININFVNFDKKEIPNFYFQIPKNMNAVVELLIKLKQADIKPTKEKLSILLNWEEDDFEVVEAQPRGIFGEDKIKITNTNTKKKIAPKIINKKGGINKISNILLAGRKLNGRIEDPTVFINHFDKLVNELLDISRKVISENDIKQMDKLGKDLVDLVGTGFDDDMRKTYLYSELLGRSVFQLKYKDLSNFSFDLSFAEAKTYFTKLLVVTPEKYEKLSATAKSLAFTVERTTSYEAIIQTKRLIEEALAQGFDFIEFKKRFNSIIGLTDKSDSYARYILRTNVATSYSAGVYEQMQERDDIVAWQILPIEDDRTTEYCAGLINKIFMKDDPRLASVFPPNHGNCRTDVIALTQEDLDENEFDGEIFKGELMERPDDGFAVIPSWDNLQVLLDEIEEQKGEEL